jgi:hypothetical protein
MLRLYLDAGALAVSGYGYRGTVRKRADEVALTKAACSPSTAAASGPANGVWASKGK